jgi:hypothetical protein
MEIVKVHDVSKRYLSKHLQSISHPRKSNTGIDCDFFSSGNKITDNGIRFSIDSNTELFDRDEELSIYPEFPSTEAHVRSSIETETLFCIRCWCESWLFH